MKTTLALSFLFVSILLGGYLYSAKNTLSLTEPFPVSIGGIQSATTTRGAGKKTVNPSGYTLVQVARHNTNNDCWSTISGNVYNLTSWIAQHPGGESAILMICGKDGTRAFEGQHADSGRAQSALASLKIASLVP